MSSLGGFGRSNADVRCGALKCRDIQILDKDCNLNIPTTARITHLCVREDLATPKITEKVVDQCVVVDKPLILNPHGIGRAWFDDDIAMSSSTGNVLMDSEDWVVSFETFGPDMLKQGGHLVQLPASYDNPCIGNSWCAFVEVNASFKILFEKVDELDFSLVGVSLVKNWGTPGQETISESCLSLHGLPVFGTLQFHDIVKCLPDDSLDFEVFWDLDGGKGFVLLGESVISHMEIKMLGFQPQLML